MNREKLRKALDIIALNHAEGKVSNDLLIKACERYKHEIGFEDDYAYNIIVSKSCIDAINGLEPNEAFIKAIVPGQTKVIDGTMYVYSATQPGSKTPYAWHVVNKGTKTAAAIGKGIITLTDAAKQNAMVNSMFPSSPDDTKVINANIGGSTGAKLVEDGAGNRFIMKKNNNRISVEHVQTEYLANQVYDLMGLRVPNYELYDEKDANGNQEAVLLSQFLPMMTQADPVKHGAEMAKGFIADVLLANWDVYQNDNCLVNQAGQVFRVDNGSCFNFRASGGTKIYDHNVKKTYQDMIKFNPVIFQNLTDQDIIDQIDAITKRKDEIVSYVEEQRDNALASIVKYRIDGLQEIKKDIQYKINRHNRYKNVPPRKLKDAKEMYRVFTDKEVKDFWANQPGTNGSNKVNAIDSNGWQLLETICKARGFDARPRIVTAAEYDKLISDAKTIQLFRGLQNKGGTTYDEYMAKYCYDDNCYYGNYAAYGQGIYAHVNDGTKQSRKNVNIKNSSAFAQAVNYYTTGQNSGAVLHMAFEKDAKIAKAQDLRKEILDNPPVNVNLSEVKKLEGEKDTLGKDIKKKESEYFNLSDVERKRIYKEMHYDEAAVAEMQLDLGNIDWGKQDDKGNYDMPSYKDLVLGKISKWIKANGGTVKTDSNDEIAVFTLPNSRNKFTLTKYQYEHNSIKQANPFAQPYNLPVRKFEQWFNTEHAQKVADTVRRNEDELDDKVQKLKTEILSLKSKYRDIEDEIDKLSNPDPNADVYSAIYNEVKRGNMSAVGLYGALKGYDAMIQPNGNGNSNSYAIIFNRSKTVVKEI